MKDEYYNGPLTGYTTAELAQVLGNAIIDVLDHNDMEVVWKKKD